MQGLNPCKEKPGHRADGRSSLVVMLARRLLIALALLMAITALAAGLTPRDSPLRDTPTPTSPAVSQAAAEPVEKTLDAQSDGQRVQARVGQIVRLTVNTDELD